MRKLGQQILQILDGTPAVYGTPARGQSVVELALVTPILIVLLMGLAEIGWFANNYLILLETTRVGARFGTVQTGDTSPLEWNNQASPSPDAFALSPDQDFLARRFRSCEEVRQFAEIQGFYNLLTCVMLQSMAPLTLRGPGDPQLDATTPNVDDIVISGLSFQLVDPSHTIWSKTFQYGAQQGRTYLSPSLMTGLPSTSAQVLVVGRYPTNANECTVNTDGSYRVWERDPFDYIQDGGRDWWVATGFADVEANRNYLELEGADTSTAGNATSWERQRGFSWTGQHTITETNGRCVGSEWSTDEVQALMNLPSFSLTTTNNQQRGRLPSQGMVLVEMFWRHELLLKNPVFNPVFTILGPNTVISVWAAFPVPAIEPRIRYE
jgi:hypothetical protein